VAARYSGLIDLLVLVDVVRATIGADGAYLGAARIGVAAEPIIDDVVLDERAHRPAVDSDVGEVAGGSRFYLCKVRGEGSELVVRLVGTEAQPDTRQEVLGVVPGRLEGSADAVRSDAAATAARPDGPRVAADS